MCVREEKGEEEEDEEGEGIGVRGKEARTREEQRDCFYTKPPEVLRAEL